MLNLASLKALNVVKHSKINPIIVRTLKELPVNVLPVKWRPPSRLQKASPQRTGDRGVYVQPDQSNIILEYQYANELEE